jgi:hypothetical protein
MTRQYGLFAMSSLVIYKSYVLTNILFQIVPVLLVVPPNACVYGSVPQPYVACEPLFIVTCNSRTPLKMGAGVAQLE